VVVRRSADTVAPTSRVRGLGAEIDARSLRVLMETLRDLVERTRRGGSRASELTGGFPAPSSWCSPTEVAFWSALSTAERPRWQVRTWTAKEAIFKACSFGCEVRLDLPVATTSRSWSPLAPAGPGTLGPSPCAEHPAHVRWFDPTGDHVVALAS
jgi:hypothetical protein